MSKRNLLSEANVKTVVSVCFQAYATHKEFSSDEWLRANDLKREEGPVKDMYTRISNRK